MLHDQPISTAVMLDRYAAPGETTSQQIFARVADALARCEPASTRAGLAQMFLAQMTAGAIGAGRVMANAGLEREATMVNCFVHPLDCAPSGQRTGQPVTPAQLEQALAQARVTLAMGGGVGYDFSSIAPRDALANEEIVGDVCAIIDRFDASCEALRSIDARRGAQMAVLRCDHPDVFDFVRAKRGRRRWHTFNVSVAVTHAFMLAVERDEPWHLMHRATPSAAARAAGARRLPDGRWRYASLPARRLWHALVECTRDSAEPGVLFTDTINHTNNLASIETITATNPCGEQPLPAYGSCVLGPINLARLVQHPFGFGGMPYFDFSRLAAQVRVHVRLLDNVVETTRWPLVAHQHEALAKRRIGVGVTGLADALTMLQLRYDSAAAREVAAHIARCMRHHAYAASAQLAAERGAFPGFDAGLYLAPDRPAATLAPAIRDAISRHGLRNSHLLSFAPTGSVSVAFADNCSNGIEPAYRWTYRRSVRIGHAAPRWMLVENHAYRLWRALQGTAAPLPGYFAHAGEISASAQIEMLAALQPFVDAGISKTVSVATDVSHRDVDTLLFAAWRAGLKGITIFRPDPALDAILDVGDHIEHTSPTCCTAS